ncbi:hypothetical protein P9112_008726 [Eukaryota sp. TZLM1-RC]
MRIRARDHPPPPSRKTYGFRHGITFRLLQTQNNGTRHRTTSRLFQVQQARKGFRNGTTPSSPKATNVGSSSETPSVLKDYEELQSILDKIDDEGKELRQQIMKDAEAHLEPTDCSEFKRTDPVPSPPTKEVEPKRVRGGHENGPVPSSLPNLAYSKETDENPTLHNQPLQESTYYGWGK